MTGWQFITLNSMEHYYMHIFMPQKKAQIFRSSISARTHHLDCNLPSVDFLQWVIFLGEKNRIVILE